VTALRILLARLLGLFGGARRERELRAEIDARLAEAAAEYVRQGLTPEKARYGRCVSSAASAKSWKPIAPSAASRSSPRCGRTFSTPYGR
jgi:hypothetical protein